MLLHIFLSTWFVSIYFLLNNLRFCQQFKMCKMLGFPVDITHRLTNAGENGLIPQVIWHLKLALIFDTRKVFPSAGKDSICYCVINLFLYVYLSTSAFSFQLPKCKFAKNLPHVIDHLTMFTSESLPG